MLAYQVLCPHIWYCWEYRYRHLLRNKIHNDSDQSQAKWLLLFHRQPRKKKRTRQRKRQRGSALLFILKWWRAACDWGRWVSPRLPHDHQSRPNCTQNELIQTLPKGTFMKSLKPNPHQHTIPQEVQLAPRIHQKHKRSEEICMAPKRKWPLS